MAGRRAGRSKNYRSKKQQRHRFKAGSFHEDNRSRRYLELDTLRGSVSKKRRSKNLEDIARKMNAQVVVFKPVPLRRFHTNL